MNFNNSFEKNKIIKEECKTFIKEEPFFDNAEELPLESKFNSSINNESDLPKLESIKKEIKSDNIYFIEEEPSMSSKFDFETEDLISEVKEHPEIWDCSRKDYRDRNKKCQAWQAVSSALIDNFEDKDSNEKNQIGKKLQTKWRHIKDAYAKSKRNEKKVKSGSSSKSCKKYVYSKSLEFLDSLQVQREVHESLVSCNPECSGTRSKGQHEFQQLWKKTKTSEVEDELIKFMRNQGNQLEEDADRLFLLSLLPDVKSMNEDQKRKVKMKFMQAIDDVKHPSAFYGIKENAGYSSYGYNQGTPNNYNVPLHFNNIISSCNSNQYSVEKYLTTYTVSNESRAESPDSVDSNFSIY